MLVNGGGGGGQLHSLEKAFETACFVLVCCMEKRALPAVGSASPCLVCQIIFDLKCGG